MKKRMIGLLLTVYMMAVVFAAVPTIANAATGGACDYNLTWALDDNGTLTISGTGEMADLRYSNAPWYSDRDSIKNVVINDGVTSIGPYAFIRCENLESINIPNGVTSIGEFAFFYCKSLKSINLPNSVTSIGNDAFDDCESLTSINIPSGVTSIGYGAFAGCKILASINIPNGLTSIGDVAFQDCKSLTSIDIPDSVTEISGGAFAGCGSLNISVDCNNEKYCDIDGVLFSKDKTEILAYAKDEIQPDYTIPSSVTSVEYAAFRGCESIKSIYIPSGVTDIGLSAFYGCKSLTDINIPADIKYLNRCTFMECESLTDITLPEGLVYLGEMAFRKCYGLTTINLPTTVTFIDEWCFESCSNLADIYYAGTEQDWNSVYIGDANWYFDRANVHYGGNAVSGSTDFTYPFEYNIKNSVKWSFPTIDGGEVTNETYSNKIQVLIFLRSTGACLNSNNTIEKLAENIKNKTWGPMKNMQFIVIGCVDGAYSATPKKTTIEYKDKYAPDCDDIVFAYSSTYSSANSPFWSYVNLIYPQSSGASFALNVIIDRDNTIRFAWMGDFMGGYYPLAQSKLDPVSSFKDVAPDAWYYDAVDWAINKKITSGTGKNTFSPEKTCTRAEVMTFLWRANGSPAPNSTSCSFTDVEKGAYYYDAMLWAVENNITSGTSDTTFSPDETCTHAEVLTFMHRAAGESAPKSRKNPFTDGADDWYYSAVLWAMEHNITNGVGNDATFEPNAQCTRAQIVTFLYRSESIL